MLENLQPLTSKRGQCRVRTVAEELEPKDSQLLWDYVSDTTNWSAYGLASALKQVGVSISVNSILRHRNGLCSC